MTPLRFSMVSMPKDGQASEQNEDAGAVAAKFRRAALCDGASEGWQSGAWARILAKHAVLSPPDPATFAEWLAAAREEAPPPAPSASWYAEAKQEQGSFATLLGLSFEDSNKGGLRWRALAVGDTCLFQVRGHQRLVAFPVESSADFSNRPPLLGSSVRASVPEPQWFAGRAEAGDLFYLLTDAVAEWFLRDAESGNRPWLALDKVTVSADAFDEWIKLQRTARAMKNDDATAVRVAVG